MKSNSSNHTSHDSHSMSDVEKGQRMKRHSNLLGRVSSWSARACLSLPVGAVVVAVRRSVLRVQPVRMIRAAEACSGRIPCAHPAARHRSEGRGRGRWTDRRKNRRHQWMRLESIRMSSLAMRLAMSSVLAPAVAWPRALRSDIPPPSASLVVRPPVPRARFAPVVAPPIVAS